MPKRKARKSRDGGSDYSDSDAISDSEDNYVELDYRKTTPGKNRNVKKRKIEEIKDKESYGSLYKNLSTSSQINHIVLRFIKDIKTDQFTSMIQIIELLLNISGTLDVDLTFISDLKAFKSVNWEVKLNDYINNKSEYPFVSKTKKITAKIEDFFSSLVIQIKNHILIYNQLITLLLDFLYSMSISQCKSIRHVGTIISMIIAHSFIKIEKDQNKEKENIEKKMLTSTQSLAKSLSISIADIENYLSILNRWTSDIYENIFCHRYRDVNELIRADVIEYYCTWILSYPDKYLTDQHIKYFGWLLYDNKYKVRKMCIMCLIKLYKPKDNLSKLGLFTDRFLSRIKEMCFDKDINIFGCVLQFLCLLYSNDYLETDDVNYISKLLFHINVKIRNGTIPFLMIQIPDSKKKKTEEFIHSIIQIISPLLTPGSEQEEISLLCESLYTSNITNISLNNLFNLFIQNYQSFNEKTLFYLISILQNMWNLSLKDTESKKSRNMVIEDIISGQFIESYIQLLVKYQSNIDILEQILNLLNEYSVNRIILYSNEIQISKLLSTLQSSFFKLVTPTSLSVCIRGIICFFNNNWTGALEVKTILEKIFDNCINTSNNYMQLSPAKDSKEDWTNCEICMNRLSSFLQLYYIKLEVEQIDNYFNLLIICCQNISEVVLSSVDSLLTILVFDTIWLLKTDKESTQRHSQIEMEEIYSHIDELFCNVFQTIENITNLEICKSLRTFIHIFYVYSFFRVIASQTYVIDMPEYYLYKPSETLNNYINHNILSYFTDAYQKYMNKAKDKEKNIDISRHVLSSCVYQLIESFISYTLANINNNDLHFLFQYIPLFKEFDFLIKGFLVNLKTSINILFPQHFYILRNIYLLKVDIINMDQITNKFVYSLGVGHLKSGGPNLATLLYSETQWIINAKEYQYSYVLIKYIKKLTIIQRNDLYQKLKDDLAELSRQNLSQSKPLFLLLAELQNKKSEINTRKEDDDVEGEDDPNNDENDADEHLDGESDKDNEINVEGGMEIEESISHEDSLRLDDIQSSITPSDQSF